MHDSRDDLAMRVISTLVNLLAHEIREIKIMSASTQAQLDALTAAVADAVAAVQSANTTLQTVGTGIDKEIQQLVDAIAAGGQGGGISPAMTAQIQASIDSLGTLSSTVKSMNDAMTAAATKLGADDATAPPPAMIDPAALASAIAAARAAGATDVQLQAVTALGDGVATPITKAQLTDAITTAEAAAGDGTAPATAEQLAALIALVS